MTVESYAHCIGMTRHWLTLLLAATGLSIAGEATPAATPPAAVLPLVEMQAVRLPEAIRQLARQARLNVILDPRLDTVPFNQLTVSVRWENVTAEEALRALLDNYDLVIVDTPARRSHAREQIW